jgi:hypothetical protein
MVTPPAAALDRNLARAAAVALVIERDFRADGGGFRELYPSDGAAYSTLWPLSQTVIAFQGAARLAGMPANTVSALALFARYWDAGVTPSGYTAAADGGDRKFFDDNAWAGLALVQQYRLSGDAAALARAREVFDFDISGWDTDLSHGLPGGVWWSQQNPNPRFAHRNTVSTASSAELGLQLYAISGRSEPKYLDWARRMYDWVDTNLRGTNGLYGDHVDVSGVVDGGQLTYNQGTMLGASVLLYRITGSASYLARAREIADASIETFGPGGWTQPPAYNAIFFRNLLQLDREVADGRYRAAMQTYADQVWDTSRNPDSGLFDFVYGRNRAAEPHRLLDQAAMLQIYADLALESNAYDGLI